MELSNMENYKIHDNGSRPFLVTIKNNNVQVYKLPDEFYNERNMAYDRDYTKFVKEFKNVNKVFIGKSQKSSFDSNTILLQISKNRYVYIGSIIYEFTADNDEIVEYFSYVGNSNVPYPVALGNNYVYFMLDKVYIDRNLFPKDTNWIDAYTIFYSTFYHDKSFNKGMKNVKIIHERIK